MDYQQDPQSMDEWEELQEFLEGSDMVERQAPAGHVVVRLDCPVSCTARDAVRQLRIDNIKREILEKLHLSAPPPFNRSTLPIPDIPAVRDMMSMQGDGPRDDANNGLVHGGVTGSGQRDDEDGLSRSFIDFAERVPVNLSSSQVHHRALYFSLARSPELIGGNNVLQRAKLGVFIRHVGSSRGHFHGNREGSVDRRRATLTVSKVNSRGGLSHVTKQRISTNQNSEYTTQWAELDVTSAVIDWMNQPITNRGLVVDLSASNRDEWHLVTHPVFTADQSYKPYLDMTVQKRQYTRTRRNTNRQLCDERGVERLCCRYPLDINFDAFGWDWIIAPRNYAAFYCSGDCPFAYINTNANAYLIQQTRVAVKSSGGPCCTPKDLSPISLLYFDSNMRIVRGVLPDMVVNRCSCA